MLTTKRPNDPVMTLNIMNPDMEVIAASMFFFSDIGKAVQRQMDSNLDGLIADPDMAVMYLIHPTSDEDILKYEEQIGKPVAALSDRLEDLKHGTN
jgi:hypothetical protein